MKSVLTELFGGLNLKRVKYRKVEQNLKIGNIKNGY